MKTKITRLLEQLGQGLVEREQTLKLALLTVLAGENLVLVGPPGTGKSLVARRVAQSLSGDGPASHFEYLLTKFSTPEELFGPLSISALKADRFHRNTAGYLPTVRIAFLDEIFKASSSILNALLTILNERVYHNGTEVQPVPLQSLIAASNELPADQEELAALYDRFLVRVFVDYVGTSNLSRLFEPTTEPTLPPQDLLTAQDLAQIRQAANQVVFEPALIQTVQDIWATHKETFKEDRRERLSDRRLKKVIHLMRVSAATNGREAVDLSDLMLLKDCLWNHADNAPKVLEVVLKTLQRHSRQVLASMPMPIEEKVSKLAKAPHRSGFLVKGYVGSGTVDDPLLIQSVGNLVELARPEVGLQGYHFLQTTDLDARSITPWPVINFQGHFDGQGYSISRADDQPLFQKSIQSHFSRLNLEKTFLTKSAIASEFNYCKTSGALASIATDCTILSCEAGGRLISAEAKNCKISFCISKEEISKTITDSQITSCQSGSNLVIGSIRESAILDCLVNINEQDTSGIIFRGVIANEIIKSRVERCFITGSRGKNHSIVSIAKTIDASTIRQCAIGKINGASATQYPNCRIAQEIKNQSTIENTIAHESAKDSNPFMSAFFTSDQYGKQFEYLPTPRFNQQYFEQTMDWDFEAVWIWDIQNNHPYLRQIGSNAPATPTSTAAPSKAVQTINQLHQQVKANIWL